MGAKGKVSSYEATGSLGSVLLLYSGGLDTSCMIKYIQDQYGAEVITLTVDLGQPGIDLEAAKEEALEQGAKSAHVKNLKEKFAQKFLSKAIKANAMYQGGYPLSTAIGRYLTVEEAVKLAKEEGVDAIAHGATGKGNDQVRFDAAIQDLAPEMKILAPVREWNMTRDEELEYAKVNGIEVDVTEEKPYSTDENMWGKSSECGPLEDPMNEPPKEVFEFVTVPEEASDKPEYVDIGFESGVPVSLDGQEMELQNLIEKLNWKAGKHGVGIIDIMEDRVVGLKSREVYECPAAVTILKAHEALQKLTSTKHENNFKNHLEQKWAEMAYSGLWFDPLMDHLNSFFSSLNEHVNGVVKVKLYKGNAKVVGRKSENQIYDQKLATYENGQTFNQKASPGFIELWNLQTKMAKEVNSK